MEVRLCTFADACSVGATGKLNMLGTFNILFFASFPALRPINAACLIDFEPSEVKPKESAEVKVVIRPSGSDTLCAGWEGRINLEPSGEVPKDVVDLVGFSTNLVWEFPVCFFEKPGQYEMEVVLNGKEIARRNLFALLGEAKA